MSGNRKTWTTQRGVGHVHSSTGPIQSTRQTVSRLDQPLLRTLTPLVPILLCPHFLSLFLSLRHLLLHFFSFSLSCFLLFFSTCFIFFPDALSEHPFFISLILPASEMTLTVLRETLSTTHSITIPPFSLKVISNHYYTDAVFVVFVLFSAGGLLSSIAVLVIYVRHSYARIIKATSRELSYIMLAGVALQANQALFIYLFIITSYTEYMTHYTNTQLHITQAENKRIKAE